MIYSIAQWVENLALGFTIGTNLFVGGFPDLRADATMTPDRAVAIIDQTGSAVYFDVPDRADLVLQFLARGNQKRDPMDDSNTIFKRIHGIAQINLPPEDAASGSEYVAMTIEANAGPQYIGQDEKGRFQYSTNYIFRIRNG